MLHDDFKILTL